MVNKFICRESSQHSAVVELGDKQLTKNTNTNPNCVKNTNTALFGCCENVFDTSVKRFDKEWFLKHLSDERLEKTVDCARAQETKEGRDEVKKHLPLIIIQGVIPSGKARKNDNVVALSGFVVTDFDHVGRDRSELVRIYNEQIAPKIGELGIVWVFISPSGDGIKVISLLREEDTILQARGSLATQPTPQNVAYWDRKCYKSG